MLPLELNSDTKLELWSANTEAELVSYREVDESVWSNFGAIYVIFHVGGGDVSLGPHRLIKGRRGGAGRGMRRA